MFTELFVINYPIILLIISVIFNRRKIYESHVHQDAYNVNNIQDRPNRLHNVPKKETAFNFLGGPHSGRRTTTLQALIVMSEILLG